MFMAWPRTSVRGSSDSKGGTSSSASSDEVFDTQQVLSRGWFHEVARRSAFEKASFAWVASKLSTPLRKLFVSSLYIYEPEQRCCAKFPNGTAQPCRPKSPNESSSSKTSRRRSKKRGMMKRQKRRLTMI